MTPHPALAAALVVLAGSLTYDPQILTLRYDDGREERLAATSPATCAEAARAIAAGRWLPDADAPAPSASCAPGDLFQPGSQAIAGVNDPAARARR